MPRAIPREFRDDVVAIARRRETSFAQIAKDLGISETTVQNCVSKAEIDEGVKPSLAATGAPIRVLIADELADLGFEGSERRVWRLCSQQGIVSASTRKKRGKAGKQGPPVHDDLVQRQFTAEALNLLWLTDNTEQRTGEGNLYLCAIKDVFSNRIVGYSIDDRMTAELAVNALRMAIQRRHTVDTTVYSDRGSQFRSRRFVLALSRAGLVRSMGRVGAAGDNAAMESFFALLQKNVLDQHAGQPASNCLWQS